MAVTAPRTKQGITMTIARDPGLVRTVRLVAAAVARRYAPRGTNDPLVEQVRLAVGEACSVLVNEIADGSAPIELRIELDDTLVTTLSTPGRTNPSGPDPWVVLRGLVPRLRVTEHDNSTVVTAWWSIGR
ncbi:MAG: ATP-binding protein [Nocardioidaceae bacterium]